MRKLDRLISRYEEFHQDETNRLVHFICVPLIALSLVGLLWCIKIPTTLGDELSFTLNAGAVFIILASVYYLFLSIGSFVGMLYFGLAASVLCISVEASPLPLFAVSLTVFVLAWAGQFIGHGIEGKKPAFTEDIQFLLVSPAWLLDALYRKPAVTLLTALLVGCGTFGLADRLFVMKPSVDFSAALGHAAKYDVQIIRDEWGIPHILGKTDADTAHGLAYAHAEDDFETIQDVFLAVRGKLASEAGLAMAPNDYYVHLIRLWDGLDEKYATLDPKFRAICQGYCDGLNLYASRHPEKLKRNIWPAKPQDLVAGSIHKLPMMFGLHNALARLMADTEKPSPVASVLNPDSLPLGSNFVAVGPSRSTDGATRVCINSHQPWTGPVAWYEAHLISEEGQNIYGGLFAGSPVIFLGHNENIAWGHTVNQPDLVDTFELELNPENENQYKIDGEWLELERRLAPLEIRLWRDFRWTVNRRCFTRFSVRRCALTGGFLRFVTLALASSDRLSNGTAWAVRRASSNSRTPCVSKRWRCLIQATATATGTFFTRTMPYCRSVLTATTGAAPFPATPATPFGRSTVRSTNCRSSKTQNQGSSKTATAIRFGHPSAGITRTSRHSRKTTASKNG